MGIPVVCGVVFSDEFFKIKAVSCVCPSSIVNFPGADSLIVDLDIFCLTAGLVNSEDAVRIIFTGEGKAFLVVLN